MLSTASMIRLAKCYQNLMIDLKPTNLKLAARAVRIVMQATGATEEQAEEALRRSDDDVKLAILMTITGTSLEQAKTVLSKAGGFLRQAISLASS
jgi:N-acetylmuramic acid 6-phosphate etherase